MASAMVFGLLAVLSGCQRHEFSLATPDGSETGNMPAPKTEVAQPGSAEVSATPIAGTMASGQEANTSTTVPEESQ